MGIGTKQWECGKLCNVLEETAMCWKRLGIFMLGWSRGLVYQVGMSGGSGGCSLHETPTMSGGIWLDLWNPTHVVWIWLDQTALRVWWILHSHSPVYSSLSTVVLWDSGGMWWKGTRCFFGSLCASFFQCLPPVVLFLNTEETVMDSQVCTRAHILRVSD